MSSANLPVDNAQMNQEQKLKQYEDLGSAPKKVDTSSSAQEIEQNTIELCWINMATGANYKMAVPTTITTGEIKEMIAKKLQVPESSLGLFCKGRRVDSNCLAYMMKNKLVIEVIQNGGQKSRAQRIGWRFIDSHGLVVTRSLMIPLGCRLIGGGNTSYHPSTNANAKIMRIEFDLRHQDEDLGLTQMKCDTSNSSSMQEIEQNTIELRWVNMATQAKYKMAVPRTITMWEIKEMIAKKLQVDRSSLDLRYEGRIVDSIPLADIIENKLTIGVKVEEEDEEDEEDEEERERFWQMTQLVESRFIKIAENLGMKTTIPPGCRLIGSPAISIPPSTNALAKILRIEFDLRYPQISPVVDFAVAKL